MVVAGLKLGAINTVLGYVFRGKLEVRAEPTCISLAQSVINVGKHALVDDDSTRFINYGTTVRRDFLEAFLSEILNTTNVEGVVLGVSYAFGNISVLKHILGSLGVGHVIFPESLLATVGVVNIVELLDKPFITINLGGTVTEILVSRSIRERGEYKIIENVSGITVDNRLMQFIQSKGYDIGLARVRIWKERFNLEKPDDIEVEINGKQVTINKQVFITILTEYITGLLSEIQEFLTLQLEANRDIIQRIRDGDGYVVLTGGMTMIPGIKERIITGLKNILSNEVNILSRDGPIDPVKGALKIVERYKLETEIIEEVEEQ